MSGAGRLCDLQLHGWTTVERMERKKTKMSNTGTNKDDNNPEIRTSLAREQSLTKLAYAKRTHIVPNGTGTGLNPRQQGQHRALHATPGQN